MKKKWMKVLAVILTICMLPWQEGYVAYAAGIMTEGESQANVVVGEDLVISNEVHLTENTSVASLTVNSYGQLYLDGYTLVVNGDTTILGEVYLNQGTMTCFQNVTIKSDGFITMNDINDLLQVKGNFSWDSTKKAEKYLTAGILEVGGDIVSSKEDTFKTGSAFKTILNGTGRQTISLMGVCSGFGILELKNTSEEGIYSDNSFVAENIIDNDESIIYNQENMVYGYTLQEDTTIEGDMILCHGEMDLNGHSLTVNGNFIQVSGTMNINHGALNVVGDYRMQTQKVSAMGMEYVTDYSAGYGKLLMINEDDIIHVYGDFVSETIYNHTGMLMNGKLYLYGDMTVLGTASEKAFVPEGGHTTYLCGTVEQVITFPKYVDVNNSRFQNLSLVNEIGTITFVNAPYVNGILEYEKEYNGTYMGYVSVGGNTIFCEDVFAGSVIFVEDRTLNSNLSILGDVQVRCILTLDGGILEIGGCLVGEEKNPLKSYQIIMNQDTDCVKIGKDINMQNGISLSGGRIELKGDIISNVGFFHNGTFVFNGETRQNVLVEGNVEFHNVSIENTSEEGVYSGKTFICDKLLTNGNKLVYGDTSGAFGWSLSEDEIFEGDLVLLGDTLNLNGHTLTINGDFYHKEGVVDINNGALIVNGSYVLCENDYQSNGDSGVIKMNDDKDYILINGDFTWSALYWINHELTKGTLEVKGNISLEGRNFNPEEEFTVILSGTKKQTVCDYSSTSTNYFNALILKNESAEGIEFINYPYIKGRVESNGGTVSGDVRLNPATLHLATEQGVNVIFLVAGTLEEDITIKGNLNIKEACEITGKVTVLGDVEVNATTTINGTLDVKGALTINGTMNVYGEVVVAKDVFVKKYSRVRFTIYGSMIIEQSLYYDSYVKLDNGSLVIGKDMERYNENGNSGYSQLIMFGENSSLLVLGNCYLGNNATYSVGTIEVKGNLTTERMTTTGDCKIILSGNQFQTLSIPQSAVIETLDIRNTCEEGTYSENIIYINNLITNGNKISFGNNLGVMGWTLEEDTIIEDSLILLNGKLDLNGYKLTIKGDYIQQGGETFVNGGTLEVEGDYRMQTIVDMEAGVYTDTGAVLVMINEADKVIVKGDYYTQSTRYVTDILTDGIMQLYGDMHHLSGDFMASENHVVQLCGEEIQTLECCNTGSTTKFAHMAVNNPSGIQLINVPYITGSVDDGGNNISGTIKLSIRAQVMNGEYHGDVEYYEDYGTSNSIYRDVTIYGNVVMDTQVTISKDTRFIIYGNAQFKNKVTVDGEILCHGESLLFNGEILLNGSVLADGDITCGSINKESTGLLEVKGNLTTSYVQIPNTRILMSGEARQVIQVGDSSQLGTLELQNYSEEGVYSYKTLTMKELIRNGSRLTYGDITGEMGWKLEQDVVYDGDFTLIGDVLDLNGYNLTVNGNFIHVNGTLKVNGGTLTINGNYQPKSETNIYNRNSYNYSKGILVMDNTEDVIDINGNLILKADAASNYQLTDGKIYVSGDVIQEGSAKFVSTLNHEIIMDGHVAQKMTFTVQPTIARLIIENESMEGVDLWNDIYVVRKLSDVNKKLHGQGTVGVYSLNILENGIFGGNISTYQDQKLNQDVNITGKLTLQGKLYLQGHKLYVGDFVINSKTEQNKTYNGELYVEDGSAYAQGTMSVQNAGMLIMKTEGGYVKVYGDFNMSSSKSHEGYLTEGTLEIFGNFNQTSAVNFVATKDHMTILDGKKMSSGKKMIQTVKFAHPGNAHFNILVLTRQMDEGYQFNCTPSDVYNRLRYDIPRTVNMGSIVSLKADEIGTGFVTISFEYTGNNLVSGYEIYRDGVLVGITNEWKFVDDGLTPSKEYTYTVCAFDANDNRSEYSEGLKVVTLDDTFAPQQIEDLHVTARTGSSVTLAWSTPEDDSGIAYYNVYRDGELLKSNIQKNEYCDTNLDAKSEYYYEVIAVDKAGNESDKSNRAYAVVQIPQILEIVTQKEIVQGKTRIEVHFVNQGNYDKNIVKLEYGTIGGEWQTIKVLTAYSIYAVDNHLCVSYVWDSTVIASEGDYIIRATSTDGDGCSNVMEKMIYIDNIAPKKVVGENIESMDGTIRIQWQVSEDADCIGYKVYRLLSGQTKTLIEQIDDRQDNVCTDINVKEGITYRYVITAIDDAGNESEVSEVLTTTVTKDANKPFIKSITPSDELVGSEAIIKVTATDNKEIAKMAIYYSQNGEEWTLIESKQNKSNEITFKWNTAEIMDGEYQILARAWDESGNVSDDLESSMATVTINHVGPEAVDICRAEPTAGNIRLEWEVSSAEDFAYYIVEQLVDGEYQKIFQTDKKLSHVVTGLRPETEYSFRVIAYDSLGNRGEEGVAVTVKTEPDMVEPSIILVNAVRDKESNNKEILFDVTIRAVDDTGLQKGVVAVSTDGIHYTNQCVVNAGGMKDTTMTATLNLSKYNGQTVYIRYEVYDIAGNVNKLPESMPDGIVQKILVDNEPPERVNNVHVTGCQGSVELSWDAAKEEDFDSYNVYRCEGDTGIYRLIATGVKSHSYVDVHAQVGTKYEYQISAVDVNGNEGMRSVSAFAIVTVDVVAPIIRGMAPAVGVIGQNPVLQVLVTDNAALDKVTVSYKNLDNPYETYQLIGTWNTNASEFHKEIPWNTTGLLSGNYQIKVEAWDLSGNKGLTLYREYQLDNEAPDTPNVCITAGNYEVSISVDGNDEEDFYFYSIQRRSAGESEFRSIANIVEKEYVDTTTTMKTTYYYKVVAYDTSGNKSDSNIYEVIPLDVDDKAPKAMAADYVMGLAGQEVMLDGSGSTDNIGVTSYEWNMGDGTVLTGSRCRYTFDKTGTYAVELTVADAAGNTDTIEVEVVIKNPDDYGLANVTVLDTEGRPIEEALVYVQCGECEYANLTTDSEGMTQFVGEPGEYTVMAYFNGGRPQSQQITLETLKNQDVVFYLSKESIVFGSVDVHKMSLLEMLECGVNITSPVNQHVFQFRLVLGFEEKPIPEPVTIIANEQEVIGGYGGSSIGRIQGGAYCWDVDGDVIAINILQGAGEVTEEPAICYMYVTKSISWLMDMYKVDVTVLNSENKDFVLTDAKAKIRIPAELGLASTKDRQSTVVEMGVIEGRTSATASWIVKGEQSGKYNIDVDFTAKLMPFGVPVSAKFTTEKEFEVTTGEGIKIFVYPENRGYIGDNYFVQYVIYNGSGKNLYNFSTNIGPYVVEESYAEITVVDGDTKEVISSLSYEVEKKNPVTGEPVIDRDTGKPAMETVIAKPQLYYNYSAARCGTVSVACNGDVYKIDTLRPGEKIYGTYYLPFPNLSRAENPDAVYYALVDHFVERLRGKNLGVEVIVIPVESHIMRYYADITPPPSQTTADPIDTRTGAFVENRTAIRVSGAKAVELNMSYNSMLADEAGEFGYGWSYDYESSIENLNGQLILTMTPGRKLNFLSDEMKNGIIYGKLLADNTIVIDPEHRYTGRFSCTSYGMEDYYINRLEDGSYDLYTPNKDIYHYDSDGKLASMCDANGKMVMVTRANNETIFTDVESHAALTMTYNTEGQIIAASDNLGNQVTFTYEKGFLTTFTDQMGNVRTYTYDDKNRIVKVTVNGKVIAENSYDEKGRVTSQTGEDGIITLNYEDTDTEHRVVVTNPLGNITTYVMDKSYNMLSSTDANGNTWDYAYDIYGNVTRETDPLGNTISYAYDEHGNQTQITTADGNVTHIAVDENGNITRVSSVERIQNYTYDEKDRLIRSEAENGKTETYDYNELGHIIRHNVLGSGSTVYGYTNGRITSVTDLMGNTSRMEYNAVGWMTKSIDAMGNVTTYEYNDKGYNSRIIDPLGNVSSYEYDSSGNITKAVNAIGGVTSRTYDDAGRQTSVTDVMGNTTYYTYDGAGNLIRTDYADGTSASATYDAVGNQITSTDVLGQTTTYTYDALSRLVQVTDHNGVVTQYEYDCMNRVTRITADDGTYVDYEYDINGNCILEKSSDGSAMTKTFDCHNNCTSVTDYCGVSTYYTYDKDGRLLTTTDGNGNVTRYAYDAAGRCVGQTSPDGTHVKMTYDALGRMTSVGTVTETYGEIVITYEYDALGRVIKTTDEMGNVSICEYDALGRLICLKDEDGKVQAEYTYDVAGNLLTEKDSEGNTNSYTYADKTYELISLVQNVGTDNEVQYAYEYDTAGRIIKVTDPMAGVTSQTYNSSGNVASVTDPNGGTTTYEYDRRGRITAICNAIGSKMTYSYNAEGILEESTNARNQTTTYEYDANGIITGFTDEAGSVSYYYDNNGNVLTVTEILPDGSSNTITRTYDCMNRVSSYTDYKGNTINYGYDELGNLITLTYAGGEIIRYAYYPNGWIKSVTDVRGNITSYEYDSKGNCTKTIFGDGSVKTCEYDATGSLLVQETKDAAGTVLSRYEYGYDENGNIVETKGIEAGDLTRVTVAEMSYDEANRLISYNGEEVKYDADGNMTYGPLDGVMTEFTYDCRNRLMSAGNTTYEYDAENVRMVVVTPEYRDEYLVNKNSELTQILAATRYEVGGTSETTTYTYGRGLVSQYTEKNGCEYYHYNNIGSTMYLTKLGAISRRFAYGTYGELTMGEYGDIRFMYNGRFGVVTDENGLYQMRARYYNPVIRRFINQDVLLGDISNSQSLNRYSYCQGNPVSYLDPFGLSPYNSNSEMGHAILNLISFIPGVGDIADTINAIWYASEGNYAEALACAVGVLPFVGDVMSQGFKWTKVGKTLKFASNVGKMYVGGSGAWQNLENIRTMMANGTGGFWDYVAEGTMFLLNSATCYFGAAGVVDDLSSGIKYLQAKKADNLKALASEISGNTTVRDLDWGDLLDGRRTDDALIPRTGDDWAAYYSEVYGPGNVVRKCNKSIDGRCFVAGTLILTDSGSKSIEDVEVGDYVYSKNAGTGETGWKQVTELFIKETTELTYLQIGDALIETTPNHPFWVDGYGFKVAGELEAGDYVETVDGELLAVAKVQALYLDEPIVVYNFEVEDWHTYYVSEAGVFVHNDCGGSPGSESALGHGEFYIDDWTGYPDSPRPEGPFKILEGVEYEEARKLANKTNANIHSNRPDLNGTQIHEMHPVKFGGSPTDIDNKIALPSKEHAKFTAFWNKVLREQQKGK